MIRWALAGALLVSGASCAVSFKDYTESAAGGGGAASSSSGSTGGGGGGVACSSASECGMAGPCETLSCPDKQCVSKLHQEGTKCVGDHGAGFCTSAGKCVECVTGDDCDPPPPECQVNVCKGNTCATKAAPDKTHACGNNDALNCVGGKCEGCNGDGDCTVATLCLTAHCDLPTQSCEPNRSDVNTPCTDNGGHFCDGSGACKECGNQDSQCTGTPPECKTFTCESNACTLGSSSNTTTCTTGGVVCDGQGNCVACNVPGDCTTSNPNETCTAHQCGCSKSTCASLGVTCGPAVSDGCGNSTGACDDGSKDGSETDVDCGGPTTKCPTRCLTGRRCAIGSDCVLGHCASIPANKCGLDNGSSCTKNLDCASGDCNPVSAKCQ